MIFKFTGKGLFIAGGIVCLLSVFLSPFALVLFYMAGTTHFAIEGDKLIYKMLFKKTIPFSTITRIYVKKAQQNRQYMSATHTTVNLNTIIPMVIEYGNNKKIKFSLNYFQNNEELANQLELRTGKKIEWPDYSK